MDKQVKKKYEKPQLKGEKLFEAVAVACCKDADANCNSARAKNRCGSVGPST